VILSGALVSSCGLVSGFDDLVFDLGGPAGTERPLGAACAADTECASRKCIDGVCCDRSCGECAQCNLPGSEGQCVNDPVGPDPNGGCENGVCDGAGSCARGNHAWSHGYGDIYNQRAQAVATGPGGVIVIAGTFDGTLDFGPGHSLTSAGSDVFLATLDRDGQTLAANLFSNTAYYAYPTALAVDDEGDVYLAVDFEATFPGLPASFQGASADGAVLKIVDGAIAWATPFWGQGVQRINSIAIDDDGNVFVTGHYEYDLWVGDVAALPALQVLVPNAFVTKLRGDGTHLWSNDYGDDSDQQGWGIAVSGNSASASVAIAGEFMGSIDLGGTISGNPSYVGAYAAVLAEDGNATWGKGIAGGGDHRPRKIAFGVDGEVVMWGSTSGPLELGESTKPGGGTDAFVAQFAADGTPLFAGIYGGTGEENGYGLAVTPNGHMVVAGSFDSELGFGGPKLTAVGGTDGFVAKLSRDGQELWSHKFGFDAEEWAVAVAINEGRVVVVGDFAGIVDFGGTPETHLESAGGTDIFVATFDP
jgi:hypothetical protein